VVGRFFLGVVEHYRKGLVEGFVLRGEDGSGGVDMSLCLGRESRVGCLRRLVLCGVGDDDVASRTIPINAVHVSTR